MQQTNVDTMVVDLAQSAPNMVEAAVAVTTGRLNLASTLEVRRRIVRGDAAAIGYFRYELAHQVAAALLWMDRHVQAVYDEHDVPAGEEVAPDEPTLDQPLRLFVDVDVQTPALSAAVDALSDALSHAIDSMTPRPPRRMIEAIVIDGYNRRLLQPGKNGFRPAPLLLAAREVFDPVRIRDHAILAAD